jgi:DNA-binding HxlR family transcriptional regulator
VRSYGQYCPIARGAEIFATRWTPLIVRNLLLGCRTFGEIQAGAPGIPRSLLVERLKQLERLGVIERRPNPAGRGSTFELTDAGRELEDVCYALGRWGARWLEVAPEHLDAHVVLWAMCRLIETDKQLPAQRVVVRFDLHDLPKRPMWIVADPDEAEVCVKPPGVDPDLHVTTDSEWLTKWHMGRISLGHAMHNGLIEVRGPRRLVRQLATWGLSAFKDVQPAPPATSPAASSTHT